MIENIRIFAADIDGTLAGKGEMLMPKTKEALNKLHKQGILIGPASGRPLDGTVINLSKKWGLDFEFDFAIGMNGGDLWTAKDNQMHRIFYLEPETIKEILEFIWDLDINAIIYRDAYADIKAKRIDKFLLDSQKRNNSKIAAGDIECLSEVPTGKIEVHLKHKDLPEMMRRIEEHKSDKWTWVKTFEITPENAFFLPPEVREDLGDHVTIEFQDPRVNKGAALENFCAMNNIPIEESIAFGDMQNDYGLIKSAGWGVCLLNGCDECKSIAQAVTEHPVSDDGVGNYLEDHWFNK